MKVKMKTLDAGPNGILHPGKEYDLDAKEAKALIEGGYAEEVKQTPKGGEAKNDGDQNDNSTGKRAGNNNRGKNSPKN